MTWWEQIIHPVRVLPAFSVVYRPGNKLQKYSYLKWFVFYKLSSHFQYDHIHIAQNIYPLNVYGAHISVFQYATVHVYYYIIMLSQGLSIHFYDGLF